MQRFPGWRWMATARRVLTGGVLWHVQKFVCAGIPVLRSQAGSSTGSSVEVIPGGQYLYSQAPSLSLIHPGSVQYFPLWHTAGRTATPCPSARRGGTRAARHTPQSLQRLRAPRESVPEVAAARRRRSGLRPAPATFPQTPLSWLSGLPSSMRHPQRVPGTENFSGRKFRDLFHL